MSTAAYSYKTNLFETRKWQGEFFCPDNYENRFFGEIDYSPEDGIQLSYFITDSSNLAEAEILYGILDTGERCTLIGRFNPTLSGIRNCNGQTTRFGKAYFQFLLIGYFAEKDELFDSLSFSLLPMQEFFFPQGFKSAQKFSDKPLINVPTPYGELKVVNNANFSPLHSTDITSQIYATKKEALDDLKEAFKQVKEKHKSTAFMLKNDIEYLISLQIVNGANIHDAYNHIHDISNLFALLIYSPVYPEKIHISKFIKELNYSISIRLYPSMMIDENTVKICKQERHHFHMPLKKDNVDLAAIIDLWLKKPSNYATIISSLQREVGYRTEHTAHGELVLYATQLESITSADGQPSNVKYAYPIKSYASDKLQNIISNIFRNVGENDIGLGISDLRNEIAHIGRAAKLLSVLSLKELMTISRIMHLTIIGYILRSLGLSNELISAYQDSYCAE